ncbi:MAG: hypothetical protein AB7N91_10075 [Candidatus Tectimicrobiota bacterium]
MQHLARVLHPREYGLTPYQVVFRRAESHPLPSMQDEGVQYQHPEREDTAIVWAQDAASIAAVLTYHYQDSWSHLRVLSA